MLSPETLERYRRMTFGERLKLTCEMMERDWPALVSGSPEVVAKKFALLRRQNDERNQAMLEGIARTRE